MIALILAASAVTTPRELNFSRQNAMQPSSDAPTQPADQSPEPSEKPNNSSDPTKSDTHLAPQLPPLPGARDFHRQQYARLQSVLQRAVPQYQDPLGQEDLPENLDPKANLARAEHQAQQALMELTAAQVLMVSQEVLVLMAKLDLKDLQALKQKLTTKGWLTS